MLTKGHNEENASGDDEVNVDRLDVKAPPSAMRVRVKMSNMRTLPAAMRRRPGGAAVVQIYTFSSDR
jgi:hypothetical protein